MKKPNNTHKGLYFLVITSLIVFFLLPEKVVENNAQPQLATEPLSISQSPHRQPEDAQATRSLASIAPVKIKNQNTADARIIMGDKITKEITLINRVSQDWQQKYQKSFFRMTQQSEIKDFEIIKKRSILKVKDNIGRHMEHILVKYKKPNGNPFSFEAYVDSETGQIVRTWNQTRYEFKDNFALEADGKLFKK